MLRPHKCVCRAYQPSPGGEPEAIIDQINYDKGNGTAIVGFFTGCDPPAELVRVLGLSSLGT